MVASGIDPDRTLIHILGNDTRVFRQEEQLSVVNYVLFYKTDTQIYLSVDEKTIKNIFVETPVVIPYNAEIFCINHGDQMVFLIWNHKCVRGRGPWCSGWSCLLWKTEIAGSSPALVLKFQRNKMFLPHSLVHIQYYGEPSLSRGSGLGLRPPGLEFQIPCLEGSVISSISPSPRGSAAWSRLAYMCTNLA